MIHHFGGWIVSIILGITIVIIVAFFFQANERIQEKAERLVDYNGQMGELFIAWQEQISSNAELGNKRDIFIIYSSNIIINHYLDHPSTQKPMSKKDIIIFVEEIYARANEFKISPFIPLAFAAVESNFYPDAVGLDGERSVFQFMDDTVRDTYVELHTPYVKDWWKTPTEAVKVFFAHYYKLSTNFTARDDDENIRWAALAYNAGLYRNALKAYYTSGSSIDAYLKDYPLKRGIRAYNQNILETYHRYRENF
jgi:hypothetical protein